MSIPGVIAVRPPTAALAFGRRWRAGVVTTMVVAAATVSLVVVNVLAARADLRWDLSGAGESRLSPRTAAVLGRSPAGCEIVVAGPMSDRGKVDPVALAAVADVLARVKGVSGGRVRGTVIDTGLGENGAEWRGLVERLAKRSGPGAPQQAEAIAGMLRSGGAVLAVGPEAGEGTAGLAGADLSALMGPAARGEGRGDAARRAEELLGGALSALVDPARPIVVLMHAQTRAAVEKLPLFDAIGERMAMRGIDVLLWAVAESDQPPSTTRVDPSGKRPVVYVCFNTAGFAQGGKERAAKLGKALESLAAAGKPVLVSVMPSNAAAYGEKDATTAWLAGMGLEVDSGRPILKEVFGPQGRRVEAFEVVRAAEGGEGAEGEQAVLRAVRGLPTRLEWPVAIRVTGTSGVTVTPLYRVEDRNAWAESEWLSLFQVPISRHASVPNPPTKDAGKDDTSGSWVVAAAVERKSTTFAEDGKDRGRGRLVVVGANSWFTDPVLREPMQVEGRVVAANPGNAELFESCVYWLAGQDELIAQSATARAAPLIAAMPEGVQRAIQWGAIVGLPGLVLAAGVAFRVWRG